MIGIVRMVRVIIENGMIRLITFIWICTKFLVPKTSGLLLSYKSKKAIFLGMGARVSSSCNSFLVNKNFYVLLLDSQSRVLGKLCPQYRGPRIIFGLIDSSIMGRRCISIRVLSRVNVGLIE